MTLSRIRDALETACGFPFALFAWDGRPEAPYGLVSLDGAGASLWADENHRAQVLLASADVFVRGDPTEAVAAVQAALSALGVSWRLNAALYESETKIVHVEWAIEFLPEVA